MSVQDTDRSSAITDHPFMPRHGNPYLCGWVHVETHDLKVCRLAEAAHKETTVKR